jgi:multisubunit Na+/H+ antiporter MnhE subunit
MNYKNVFLTFVLSFLTWLLLNGSLDSDILISGLVLSLLISLLFCRKCDVMQYVNLSPKGFMYAFAYVFAFHGSDKI